MTTHAWVTRMCYGHSSAWNYIVFVHFWGLINSKEVHASCLWPGVRGMRIPKQVCSAAVWPSASYLTSWASQEKGDNETFFVEHSGASYESIKCTAERHTVVAIPARLMWLGGGNPTHKSLGRIGDYGTQPRSGWSKGAVSCNVAPSFFWGSVSAPCCCLLYLYIPLPADCLPQLQFYLVQGMAVCDFSFRT